MNGITQAAFVFTLWLVMGIGFLAKAVETRRQGHSWSDALVSIEGVLFIVSVLAPLVILIHRNVGV